MKMKEKMPTFQVLLKWEREARLVQLSFFLFETLAMRFNVQLSAMDLKSLVMSFWNDAGRYMSSKNPPSHQRRALHRNRLTRGEGSFRALPFLPPLSEIASPAAEQVVPRQRMQ